MISLTVSLTLPLVKHVQIRSEFKEKCFWAVLILQVNPADDIREFDQAWCHDNDF